MNELIAAAKTARKLVADRRGVTAMEYGLIAGLVAVVIIAAVTGIGTRLQGVFTTIQNALPGGGG